jgi:tetratricopeptide (TPR) repeat protein
MAHINVGDLRIEDGRAEGAEAAFQEARGILEPLVRETRGTFAYPVDLAMTYYGIGMVAQARGRPAEALPWIDQAVALLGPVIEQHPHQTKPRFILRVVCSGRAAVLGELGRQAEALRSWDRAVALVTGPVPGALRLARASTLAHLGRYAEATAEADDLAKSAQVGLEESYNLACVYALSSATANGEPALAENFAARAEELLRRAVLKGYRDLVHLRQDSDLDSIRSRPGFHELIMDLGFPIFPFAR